MINDRSEPELLTSCVCPTPRSKRSPAEIGYRGVVAPIDDTYEFEPGVGQFEIGTTNTAPYAVVGPTIETLDEIGPGTVEFRIHRPITRPFDAVANNRLLSPTIPESDLVDELIEMPRIRDALDLDSIPAPSTLRKAFDRLEMAVWRVLLNVSLADLPVSGITGIDTSGGERAPTSAHYTKRANLTIQQLKTTQLVDTATNTVLDIHLTTTRKHDTQIAPQVVRRNAASIAVLTGDKGYDD